MLLGFVGLLEVSVKETLKCLAVTSFVAVASARRQKAWRVRLLEFWGTFVESSCSLAKTHIEKDDISIIAQISKEIIILVFFISVILSIFMFSN